ncbi:hypothetical protein KUTeg_022880 [Tegillarca granosa]|uniref:Uncharacterized protein n=1 Tax=Tegillarca granosa TaxID=220873 RepID=A0ABQ9E113_TEGGR|nr:hypothetical protein KUTeg_022880 [Tegillarca granosa]
MATLNSPGMSQPTYSSIEQEIGDLWGDVVQEDLLAAGAEERRIAIGSRVHAWITLQIYHRRW